MAVPSKEEVCQQVVEVNQSISDAMGNDVTVAKATKYWMDLGYPKSLIRELAVPHTRISESHDGLRISKRESGEMVTVSDACDLTYAKILAGNGIPKKAVQKKKAAGKQKRKK